MRPSEGSNGTSSEDRACCSRHPDTGQAAAQEDGVASFLDSRNYFARHLDEEQKSRQRECSITSVQAGKTSRGQHKLCLVLKFQPSTYLFNAFQKDILLPQLGSCHLRYQLHEYASRLKDKNYEGGSTSSSIRPSRYPSLNTTKVTQSCTLPSRKSFYLVRYEGRK